MQIEENFRDTKSKRYGLGLANESRITEMRMANLLVIAALASMFLWIIGTSIKRTTVARHLQVNSIRSRTVYSTIFLARISLQHTNTMVSLAEVRRSITSIRAYFDKLHAT
jgi:hypothetical protein